MKKLLSNKCVLVLALLFTSCSSFGLLDEKNSWILEDIDSIGDFFQVYLVFQLSIIIAGVILGLIVGRAGYLISVIIHFIWIVVYRDYGFFTVLLLFGLLTLLRFIFSTFRNINRKEQNF